MATTVKCPNCGTELDIEEVLYADLQSKLEKENRDRLNAEMESFRTERNRLLEERKEFEDKKKKENELFSQKVQQEKQKLEGELRKQIEETVRKSISSDYENQVKLLEENNRENEEKLRQARQQQIEFLRKEQELKTKEAELELAVQQKLQVERESLSIEIRKLEEQRIAAKETEFHLRLKEMEEKLDAQRKLAEEMKRRAEQGSMQLQGEAQEQALEEMLQSTFPFDLILPVGKGTRGADCTQTVRNNFGQECGKIIYESKRTNAFASDWIEKLKADMRSQNADIAVIVTRSMPKDMDCFGIKDGVWICSFSEVRALASVLRDGVIRVFNTAKSNENKGDKMQLLYGYLTSNEFAEQWKAIREGFIAMKMSIQRERDAMEKLWKAREKQLDKVLLSAAHIRGSIEGISGMDAVDLNLLERGEEESD